MSDSENYTVVKQLGAGLTGPVFLAETSDSKVALRQFKPRAVRGSDDAASERSNFLDAARQAATLRDPRIVSVFEIIDEQDDAYVCMEYLPYNTLGDRLARGAISVKEANQIIRAAAAALDIAHRSGVTHGDLKPSNIFILPDGIKVSDFATSPRAAKTAGPIPSDWIHPYLGPEYLRDRSLVGPRSDQYALAAIAHQLYTGQQPLRSTALGRASATAIRPDLPRGVDAVLSRGLSERPEDRYSSCLQISYLLDEAFAQKSLQEKARPGRTGMNAETLAAAALAALIAIVLGAWFLLRGTGGKNASTPHSTGPAAAYYLPPAQAAAGRPAAGEGNPKPQTRPSANAADGIAQPLKHRATDHRGGKDAMRHSLGNEQAVRGSVQSASTAGTTEPRRIQGADTKSPLVVRPIVPAGPSSSAPLLEVFSRNNKIEPGLTFSYKDTQLGEMAHGDLKAILRMPPRSNGTYTITWLVDDVPMDSRRIPPNQVVEYDNEPSPGTYKVIVRQNVKQLTSFLFRITK